MRYERSTFLPCSLERCAAELRTPQLLIRIARPLVHFVPIAPNQWPAEWQERQYKVAMRLFGIIPVGWQIIDITVRDRSPATGRFTFEMRDNGRGALIAVWDHRITVEDAPGGCRYTDRIEIDAGLLTPAVWLFAAIFYRHRQRRWRQLVANDFVGD